MSTIAELTRPTVTIGPPLTPLGAVGDAIEVLFETLGPPSIPEDLDEILGVRCSSL